MYYLNRTENNLPQACSCMEADKCHIKTGTYNYTVITYGRRAAPWK